MPAKYTIPELIEQEKECVMVPCVYDCGSALAAKLSGAKAILLSGGELGESMLGCIEPMLTTDEVVGAVERICAFSDLPLIVDVSAGFETPLSAYRTARRMAVGGAMALLLGNEPGQTWEEYRAVLKAALKAVEGTPCIVIARKNGLIDEEQAREECIRQLTEAVELGACGTMACGLCRTTRSRELAKIIGGRVPGWKFYPDQNSVNGVPDVDNDEIYAQGFAMISYHYMMKVALAAMWQFGLENMRRRNNVASNEAAFPNGVKGASALPAFNMQRLYDLEAEFTGVRRVFQVPGTIPGRENG